jgi:indolepyruvate ferredoxin oxidoreductase, beta subunit
MTGDAAAARPLSILIGALGGEGGGVLTDWLVAAAMAADLPAQSTSIPGVAQRTGATTYYVEIFPTTNAALAGRRPVLSLYPCPGDMDVVIASELLEAGRAIENGYVTSERTTLIAATHRVYAVAEKQQMADGRFDASRILRAAREMARQPILFDLTHDAATRQLPLNAVLLGALAGSGVLPLARAGFEAAIRESGIAIDSNLAGFALGYRLASEGPSATTTPRDDRVVAPLGTRDLATLRQDAAREFPAEALAFVEEGLRRLVDYQDADYAELYLAQLRRLRAAGIDDATLAEAARHLALWMAYQDIIRVAQMKSRASRFARVRDEVRAKPNEPVRVTEFFKPGIEEVSALLPPSLGRALYRWAERRNLLHRLHLPMHVTTTNFNGFLRLWLLSRLRGWRRRGYRYAEEQALIERWLDAICRAQAIDAGFAREIVLCARLLKGYSDTHRRGHANFTAILAAIVEPTLAARQDGAVPLRRAREAALADPDGGALAKAIGEASEAGAARRLAAE